MVRRRHYIDHVARGWAEADGGDLEAAERHYRAAIRDRDSFAYNNLAQLMAEAGRLGVAEALFRQGVAAGDALAAKNLVLFLLEEGKERQAAKALRKARAMGRLPTDEEISGARAFFAGPQTE